MAQTITNLPALATGALVFTAETVLPPWGIRRQPVAPKGRDRLLITTRELAALLGVAPQTVRNHGKQIPGRKRLGGKKRGGRVMYDVRVIEKWIEESNGVTDLWLDGARMCK